MAKITNTIKLPKAIDHKKAELLIEEVNMYQAKGNIFVGLSKKTRAAKTKSLKELKEEKEKARLKKR